AGADEEELDARRRVPEQRVHGEAHALAVAMASSNDGFCRLRLLEVLDVLGEPARVRVLTLDRFHAIGRQAHLADRPPELRLLDHRGVGCTRAATKPEIFGARFRVFASSRRAAVAGARGVERAADDGFWLLRPGAERAGRPLAKVGAHRQHVESRRAAQGLARAPRIPDAPRREHVAVRSLAGALPLELGAQAGAALGAFALGLIPADTDEGRLLRIVRVRQTVAADRTEIDGTPPRFEAGEAPFLAGDASGEERASRNFDALARERHVWRWSRRRSGARARLRLCTRAGPALARAA